MRGIASITNYDLVLEFIENFGTHYTSEVIVGAKYTYQAEFDTLTFWTMEQQGFSFSTAAHLESVL